VSRDAGVDQVDAATRAMKARLAGARWEARTLLGRYPSVALTVLRARRRPEQFLTPIGPETEIVIEGFPRSGNTFAVAAFHEAQLPHDVQMAHHAHVPAQLLEGVREGLPALLVVRDPEDSVLSLAVRAPEIGVAGALRGWIRFHQPLLPAVDGIVVATFEQVVTDLGAIVERVNARFGTTFRPFVHTPEHVDAILERIREWDLNTFGDGGGAERGGGGPSATRAELKDARRAEYGRASLAGARARAERLYAALAAAAST